MRTQIVLIGICAACTGCETLGVGAADKYEGDFSDQMSYTVACNVTCTSTSSVSGRVEIELEERGDAVIGEGTVFATVTGGPASPQGCGPGPSRRWDGGGVVTITHAGQGQINQGC